VATEVDPKRFHYAHVDTDISETGAYKISLHMSSTRGILGSI